MIVYAIVDDSLHRRLFGDAIDTFVRREDAERFIEDVRRRAEARGASTPRWSRAPPSSSVDMDP